MTVQPGGQARPVPTKTVLYTDIECLATFSRSYGEIDNAAIYVEGNVIKWVGPNESIPDEYKEAQQVVSLNNRVVIPGLVNTHHHMFQCLTRCIAQDSKLFGWLTTLYPCWRHLTGADVYIAAKCAMAELIMTGCTCTSDHHYIYPNDVKLDDTIRAARDIGMRFHPTRGAMSMGESNGGLPPDEVVEYDDELILKDMKRCIEQYHDASKYSMLRMGLAPCAPFNVTNNLMVKSAQLARQYDKVRLHTHLAENQEDIDDSEDRFGCRPGEYIKRVGWDKDDVWFAHCCMLDHNERQLFAERGIGIAHCPSSNLRLASGICPVRPLLDDGVNVGLGVDGSASNDSGSMIGEARLALLLQRHKGNPFGMTAKEAFQIAIEGGAHNLGRDDIGQIAPGFAADFVGWRVDTLAFTGAHQDYVHALLYCTPGDVDLSVINGELVVWDGQLQTCDMKELIAQHTAASKRLLKFLPAREGALRETRSFIERGLHQDESVQASFPFSRKNSSHGDISRLQIIDEDERVVSNPISAPLSLGAQRSVGC